MPTETEVDDGALVLREVDDRFHVHDEQSASWLVRKITEERAYRQRVADWCEAETLRSQRREQFLVHRFGAELEHWTRQQLASQYGDRRSIHLPAGIVGFRAEPAKLLVADERALIGWCRANLPAALKVIEHVLKSEVTAHVKATGECPPGAELAGGADRFYVK